MRSKFTGKIEHCSTLHIGNPYGGPGALPPDHFLIAGTQPSFRQGARVFLRERTEPLAPEPAPAPTGGIIARAVDFARTSKEFERFWKFAVVGIIGAVVDFGTYTLLNALGWLDPVTVRLPFGLRLSGLGISGAIAFTLAVTSNFIWNRYWTYPDSRSKPLVGQLITFFLVNVVGILIRLPIIELGSGPLARMAGSAVPSLSAGAATWFGESASWAVAVVLVMFWNFFVNRYWTYNDVD